MSHASDIEKRAREFLEAAAKTRGQGEEWVVLPRYGPETRSLWTDWFVGFEKHPKQGYYEHDSTVMGLAEATFVAAAHNDAPSLVRDLLAENKRLRDALGIARGALWEQIIGHEQGGAPELRELREAYDKSEVRKE